MVTAVKSDVSKRSLVLQAACQKDLPQVVSLLKAKASPFQGNVPNRDGRDQEILFHLLTCLNIPFRSLYDLSNRLFSKHTEFTPAVYKAIWRKIPFSQAVREFDAKKKRLQVRPFTHLQLMENVLKKLDIEPPHFASESERADYLEDRTYFAPLEVVQQTLSQMHPLFDLAWTLTSDPKPIKLVDKEKINKTTYSFHSHTLVLGSRYGFLDKVRKIVFFTFYALHRQTLQGLYDRCIDRETYTVIKTYMQYRVEQVTNDFLKPIFPTIDNTHCSFEDFWNTATTYFVEPQRILWDKKRLINYLHYNLPFFASKLEEHSSESKR